jgi:hypothetical protein
MGASTLGQDHPSISQIVGNYSPWRIGRPMHCHCSCQYTLASVTSPFVISILLLYFETLGNGCAQFKSPSLLPHFPLIHHGFDIKLFHQRIQTTHSHTSCCHHCQYCNVDLVLFHISIRYTNSLISCIHVNTVDLLNIMCTLVAMCMILGRLECILDISGQPPNVGATIFSCLFEGKVAYLNPVKDGMLPHDSWGSS